MKKASIFAFISLTALSAGFATEASAWLRGGVIISEPVYPAVPYYAYPAPYPYPAPYYSPQPVPYAQPLPPAPATPAYSANPEYCREYSHTITVNGERQQAYGHACQQPDGKWKLVD